MGISHKKENELSKHEKVFNLLIKDRKLKQ